MTEAGTQNMEYPIDAVIAWVDGNDPVLAEKRRTYLEGENPASSSSGAHATRFASVNEIRYCVLSILRFAPFVRNIFIISDGQDPQLYDDLKKYFPERLQSLRIVDHKEIFEGFEDCLPTFNSISIGHMSRRIKGLAEHFVYFNDDTFLIRDMKREDWFEDGNPVIRGKWLPAPWPRLAWLGLQNFFRKYIGGDRKFKPRSSFHLGQWNSASLAGYRCRYFSAGHTPHALLRSTLEDYFLTKEVLLRKNLSFRFRDPSQFTFVALSNHLRLKQGKQQIAPPSLAYLQPFGRGRDYLEEKLKLCERDPGIRFLCVQSLDRCPGEDQQKVLQWLEKSILHT